MTPEHLGYIDLPEHMKLRGFDHAAVHCVSARQYVAHTANDMPDVIDCAANRYLYSIPNLTSVVEALVSEGRNLVFISNRGENTVGIFAPDNEAELVKVAMGVSQHTSLLKNYFDLMVACFRLFQQADLRCDLTSMVQRKRSRWSVETVLRDSKQCAGLEACQCWADQALVGHVSLVFLTFAVLRLSRNLSEREARCS